MDKLVVIMPAYNEEDSIRATLEEVLKCGYDVVVIDDCSTDRTFEILKETKDINYLHLPVNLGIGGAVQTGFKWAISKGYEYCVQVDADGQHIPSQIPKLIEKLKEGYDVVIGSRFLLDSSPYRIPIFRRLGISIIRKINSLITGKLITDPTSGFRAYTKRAMKFLIKNYASDYPEPESVVKLIKEGFKIAEVGVIMRERLAGSSSIKPLDAIYYMLKVLMANIVKE